MKKIISIGTSLLFLSTPVIADNHTAAALEHANAAVVNGANGQTPLLLEQTKAALSHTLAASKDAKSVPKTHLDAAVKELNEANELGNLGHIGSATTHAEAAVKHIEMGNRYIGYNKNKQQH
jgi:Small metal-binding protein